MSFVHGGDYPAPVYLGDSGEASATLRPADAPPDLVYGNGTRAHYLMKGEQARGLFGLYRWEMSGAVSGPGPHFHRTITESFYVLSGTVRFDCAGQRLHAGTGDFVLLPAGLPHTFLVGDEPLRALQIIVEAILRCNPIKVFLLLAFPIALLGISLTVWGGIAHNWGLVVSGVVTLCTSALLLGMGFVSVVIASRGNRFDVVHTSSRTCEPGDDADA